MNQQTADKYKAALARVGAVVIIDAQGEEDSVSDTEDKKKVVTGGTKQSPPAAENVGPVWGRKVERAVSGGAEQEKGAVQDSENNVYGSLDRGLAGDYAFGISDILSEAWQKVNGNKLSAFLAVLIYLGVAVVVSLGAGLVNGLVSAIGGDTGAVVGGILAQVLQNVLIVPLGAGMVMLGARMAVGAPSRAKCILDYYDRILPLTLTMLLMYFMIILGLVLLVIPGIYLSVAYFLAFPLVVDKGLGPWQALEASRKAITHHWFGVFGLFLILGLLYLLGIIPLLIGLIWVFPLGMIAIGIVYRNIFGVSSIAVKQ